ncbi:MAG: DUF2660 domain-containing protein [Rickettsiaceae bacterium]|nr:DUF2660 domain-containing protein [Rickettsiaceae bacterium]
MLFRFDSIFFIVLFVSTFLSFFIWRIFRSNAQAKNNYTKKDDPQGQSNYDKNLYNQEDYIPEDQKLELSWSFLYNITDLILNKFSQKHRDEIERIGENLLKFNFAYIHVVEYGIRKKAKFEKALNDGKNLNTAVSH